MTAEITYSSVHTHHNVPTWPRGYFCSGSTYKLYLKKPLRLHYVWWGWIVLVRLCYDCVCWVSHERRGYSTSAAVAVVPVRSESTCLRFPWFLELSSHHPAHALPPVGSRRSVHSEKQWDNWQSQQDTQQAEEPECLPGGSGKNLPAVRETWAPSLGWEDPLEEGMATHASILPGESPWIEEPGRLQSMGSQRVRHDWGLSTAQSSTEEPEAPVDGRCQWPAYSIWYEAAASPLRVGPCGRLGGSRQVTGQQWKDVTGGEFLFAKQGGTDCCWHPGVNFPDCSEAEYR